MHICRVHKISVRITAAKLRFIGRNVPLACTHRSLLRQIRASVKNPALISFTFFMAENNRSQPEDIRHVWRNYCDVSEISKLYNGFPYWHVRRIPCNYRRTSETWWLYPLLRLAKLANGFANLRISRDHYLDFCMPIRKDDDLRLFLKFLKLILHNLMIR